MPERLLAAYSLARGRKTDLAEKLHLQGLLCRLTWHYPINASYVALLIYSILSSQLAGSMFYDLS